MVGRLRNDRSTDGFDWGRVIFRDGRVMDDGLTYGVSIAVRMGPAVRVTQMGMGNNRGTDMQVYGNGNILSVGLVPV